MKNLKLYDVHGTRALENFNKLLTPDNNYLYWDGSRFINNGVGDLVFWINRYSKISLFTVIDSTKIDTKFEKNRVIIYNNNYDISASAEYSNRIKLFYRFKVLEKKVIPENWNYTNLSPFNLQTMSLILYEQNVKDASKKIEKINDLIKLYDSNEDVKIILNNALRLLSEN